jgi:Trehalase
MNERQIPDIRELRDNALALLAHNDVGAYTTPSGRQYPHQWNWDSALISLGLSQVDVKRALQEISTLLSAQWENGIVPHIVFHHPELAYFPDAAFWQTSAHHPLGLPTSGITQPPLLATALRQIAESNDIRGFINRWYPALVKWHRWFHVTRDVDGSGLAAILHPWESGTDDSPRWLEVMTNITPVDLPPFTRVDQQNVDGSQRPSDVDYERYVYLVDLQRRANWDPQVALANSPFCVQDVLTNAILLRADEDLIWLGEQIDADTSELVDMRSRAVAAFSDRFWDEELGLFVDFDVRNQSSIRVNTAMTFLPLWAGLASKEQADRLIEHLRDPNEYWFEPGEGFLATTASRSEPAWSPTRYWRGPIWVIVNWFLHGGLQRYGYRELAHRVRVDTIALLSDGGFVEYFNPLNGDPCGARSFSWSASLALDFLHE